MQPETATSVREPSVCAAIACARQRKGFLDHAHRSWRKRILCELRVVGPGHGGDIAPGSRAAADCVAKIIQNDVVIFRPAGGIEQNPLEHFDQVEHAYFDPGLFSKFTTHSFDHRLTDLKHPARDRPFALQGRAAPSDQERPPV
jgi:hypothetical protein